jgi:hypothetical protein
LYVSAASAGFSRKSWRDILYIKNKGLGIQAE